MSEDEIFTVRCLKCAHLANPDESQETSRGWVCVNCIDEAAGAQIPDSLQEFMKRSTPELGAMYGGIL